MGCPNLLDENILQEFLELKSIVGERLAYLIYDKRNSFFRTNENGLINEEFIERNKSFSNQRDTILSMAIEELENIDSAYIEKIKDSINEIDVNTNTKENIKPGVSELFDSNPELANQVYEALGFDQESNNISTFTNYSGAAQGGDTIWENIGKEFGLGKQVNYRPEDLKKLTKEQLKEVEDAYQQAVKDLGRRPLDVNTFAGGLVRRDYLQAKAADAVFAISTIVEPGQKDSKGYINKTNKSLVAGGTGYAVQMAINLGKPVYVFDQNKNQWFVWEIANLEKDGIEYEDFVPTGVPTLTTKFAGIGTRELNENGKQAIKNVYEKTTQSQITTQQKQQAQKLYSQYLEQGGSQGDIQGIKDFTQGKQFQKFTAEEKAKTIEQVTKEHRSITALKDLSAKLAHRIGGKVKFENKSDVDWKGYNQGMTSVLNEAYMTPDTPFHEILSHPIIKAIKKSNPELYQSLLKELETGRGKGKEVFEQVKRDYTFKKDVPYMSTIDKDVTLYYDKNTKTGYIHDNNNHSERKTFNSEQEVRDYLNLNDKYTLEEQQEEAIVTLLGELAAGKLEEKENATLKKKLLEFWKQISDFVKQLLLQYSIKIDELPITTTLNDLAEIMGYGNNKIILPGYKVEYSTPLGNKYDTLEEVNNEIRGLADANVEVDLSGVKIDKELSKEELEKIKELQAQKKEKEDYFSSKKYQQDKDFELSKLNKQLDELKNKKVEFYSQEPGLDLEDKNKYGFQDFDYIRVESTYGRGNEYHKEVLGENYEGYYIHGYNTSVGKPKKKILPISKEQAIKIWQKDESSKYEVEDWQNIYRLEDSIRSLKNDSKIKWGIKELKRQIEIVKKGEYSIENFIEKNKEYEQSKEIIEQWKKENNIQYDPEEVYSRGQEFYHVHNAYSRNNVDTELWIQNLLETIQDKAKMGAKVEMSFATAPKGEVGKGLQHHNKKTKQTVYITSYPKSEDIEFVSQIDNHTSSFTDLTVDMIKSFTNQKNERVGIALTKSVPLSNLHTIQPNLATTIDDVAHHNEIVIGLTPYNFRINYEEEVPYHLKKLIDNFNKILDDKYGKLEKVEIKREGSKIDTYGPSDDGSYMYVVRDSNNEVVSDFETYQEAENYVRQNITKYPTQTKENTTSIESVKDRIAYDKRYTNHPEFKLDDVIYKHTGKGFEKTFYDEMYKNGEDRTIDITEDEYREAEKKYGKQNNIPDEYNQQALTNLKVAALKEVARKYPRSLITSKVVPINPNMADNSEIQYSKVDSKQNTEGFKEFVRGKQFQKLTAEEKAKTIEQVTKEHRSIAALKDLSAKLAHRIGGKVEFENNPNADWKGYNQGMTSVLNEAYMTPDTPFHEILAHPIIRAIKNKNISKLSGTSKTDFINLKGFGLTLNSKTDEWEVTYTTSGYDNDRIIVEKTNLKGYKNQQNAVKILKDYSSGNKKVAFENTSLYQNLLKELETGRGKEVFEQVKRDYNKKLIKGTEKDLENLKRWGQRLKENPEDEVAKTWYNEISKKIKYGEYTIEEQQEEAIVTLLGMMAADKLDAKKDATLISKLKELWKQISDFVKSLLRQDGIKIDELPITTTLNDLAEIMGYGNNKIILPGYKVEYSTPLGNKYETLEEVNNEIKGLANSNIEVDLSGVKIEDTEFKIPENINSFYVVGIEYLKENGKWFISFEGEREDLKEVSLKDTTRAYKQSYLEEHGERIDRNTLKDFIEKNKEYEQSKEIIEQWKKENNIQYDPEEVYSRGQGFYSSIGAYSNLELDLLLKNLIQHIEDNKKAGGEFTISAFTKPIDKRLKHIEGTGDRVRFVIYPQSEHIKWAAPTDVYSGSVWDAHEKVSKDKKSELLGVSFTKAPSLRNINEVSPNLADIIDNLSHVHNELGIELTTDNFRIEYDDNIDYSTKKLIDNINKILDDKYGKLEKPDIKREGSKIETYGPSDDGSYMYVVRDSNNEVVSDFETYQEAENYVRQNITKYPTQTRESLKESIESVKSKSLVTKETHNITKEDFSIEEELDNNYNPTGEYRIYYGGQASNFVENIIKKHKKYFSTKTEANKIIDEILKEIPNYQKEYNSQAEINLKVAALKEVARKYPRSLITSKVVPINPNMADNSEIQYSKVDSKQNTEGFKEFVRGKHNSVIQLVDKRDLIPNSSAQLEIDFGQNYNAKNIQKTHNLFLEDKGFITTEEYEKLPYKDNGLTKTFYANSESDADYWVSKYGAIKVKLFGKDVGKYKMVIKKPFEIDDLPSSVEKLPKEIEETINRKKNVIQALKLKISKDNSRTNELKSKINLLNSRINKIKEKYKSDDFKLYEIAYEDVKLISENLKSFEKNLENSNLTSNELRIIVYKLVEVSYDIKGWIDVHNLVSEKYFGTEKDIANITGAIKMLDSKYKKILTNVFVRFAKLNTIYTELSEEDLIKAVADISIYNANVHTIGKSDIKLLKIVDDLLNNTATDINLEYQNKKIIINNQLKKAIDKLKISRNDLKEFFKQKRSDGIWTGDIIGEFKQEFYDKQSELIEEAKISKNWRKYFKWLNENSTSFTSKELVEISKMDEESITEIGRFSKKEVLQQKKLINDYRSFYMASVELLGKLDKYIDGELIINENESNEGISVEFKHDDAKIVDNFYYEIDSIIKENSPFEYLSNKEKKVNSKIKNIGYYYIIRNKPNENWEDLRFKEIKENETLMETYNMIMNTLDENNKYLPILNEYQSNYMPELAKPLLQRISNNGLIGMFGGLKNEIINSITEEVNSSEEIRPIIGSQTLEPIPIKMMSNNIITENKEDDIFKVLIEHSKMAISYKYKSQIEPLANASLDLIDFINEVSLKTTKAGSEYVTKFGKIKEREGGLVNAKKALKFRIESFLNNKSKDVEGVTKIKKKVKNLKGEVVEKNISLSKILDFLLGITYAKQLGAPNVISPTVNLAYGLVSNLSYAAGGVYVSEKNIIKSFIDLHSIAIGVNSKSEKTEKILTFIDSFGIFGNLYDTEVSDNGFIQKITFLQQKAELINQGSLVLAILKTIKLKDKNGNDISIYDAYTMDNGHLKWDTTKMEVQELLGNDVIYNKEKTQINFKALSSLINEIVGEVHGDYKNPMMIKKTALMRAVMQYKRFIPNAVKHRFGKEYENMNLIDEKTGKRGVLVKGRYLSYINSKIFDKNLNQYIDAKFGDIVKILISGLLFNKKNIQQLKEIDRINMMRNIRELHFILLSMAAIMALESLINDDDDNDFMVKILINSILKTQADMMFFLNPSAMSQITNNFIPVLSTIKDMQNLVYSSFKMLYGDIYYENGPWKNYSRLGVSTMKLFPGTNGAVKMFNYGSRVFEFN